MEKAQIAQKAEAAANEEVAKQRKTVENKNMLKQQLDETKEKLIKRLQNEYAEGQLLKRQGREALKAEQRQEAGKKAKLVASQQETQQANAHLQELKRLEKERELDDLRRIEEYAANKDQVMEARKQREEKKFKEKLENRQRMIDKQIEELNRIKSAEDTRLASQIQQAELKAQKGFEQKEQRRQELLTQIDRSRQQQLSRKHSEKAQEKQEELEFAAAWKVKMAELEDSELAEHRNTQERARQLQVYNRRQMDYKARKAEEEALIEEELARQAKEMLDNEQSQFNSYAEKCLQQWAGQGKNVTPMLLELKQQKKRPV